MKLIRLILILVLVYFVSVFIKLPWRPIKGEIESITIKYSSPERKQAFILDQPDEIKSLDDACGKVWSYLFGSHSWEGSPSWMIEIQRSDGTNDRIYVDEDEFGTGAKPTEKLLNYLKQNYS